MRESTLGRWALDLPLRVDKHDGNLDYSLPSPSELYRKPVVSPAHSSSTHGLNFSNVPLSSPALQAQPAAANLFFLSPPLTNSTALCLRSSNPALSP